MANTTSSPLPLSPLSAADIAAVDSLTRAMGDKHLTKTQRLEIAAMIGEIFNRAA